MTALTNIKTKDKVSMQIASLKPGGYETITTSVTKVTKFHFYIDAQGYEKQKFSKITGSPIKKPKWDIYPIITNIIR